MTKFLVLNTFKKIRDDRKSYVVFKSGEEYSLDALTVYFNEKDIKCLIETSYIEAPKEAKVETEKPTIEIMYKTTQQIQDKNGSEIEVGTQLTQKELKEKGFTKKKLEALIQEEKVMEVKIVK